MSKQEPLREARRIFAENLRRERLSQGLSQERLAERAGLHWTYVSDVERQRRNISIDNLAKLANGLGVELFELFQDKSLI